MSDVTTSGSALQGGSKEELPSPLPGGILASQTVLFAGTPQAGDTLTFTYYPISGSPETVTYTTPSAPPTPTMDSDVAGLAAAIATLTGLTAANVPLSNSYFGLLVVQATTPTSTYLNGGITVTTSGTESVVSPTPAAAPAPTFSATLLTGDGAYLANNANGVTFSHNQFFYTAGSAIHVSAATNVNFLQNVSNVYATQNSYGLYFDFASSINGMNISDNNLIGNTSVFGGATPAPSGTGMIIRNNLGYDPYGVTAMPTIGPSTPVSSIYDCYVTITPSDIVLTYSVTISTPASSQTFGGLSLPFSTYLPANASIAVTYSGLRPTWQWFCN